MSALRGPSSQPLPIKALWSPLPPLTPDLTPLAQTWEYVTSRPKEDLGRVLKGRDQEEKDGWGRGLGGWAGHRWGRGLTVELHHGAERPLQLLVDVDHGEGAVVRFRDAHVQVAQVWGGGELQGPRTHPHPRGPLLPGAKGEGQEVVMEGDPGIRTVP